MLVSLVHRAPPSSLSSRVLPPTPTHTTGGGFCVNPPLFAAGDPALTCVAGCCEHAPGANASACVCESDEVRGALCEQEFEQLVGVTFLKAVAEQRARFGDDELLRWCTRRGAQKMYESASLCTFCCQFFEAGWHSGKD